MKTQHTPGPWWITAHDALRGTFEVNAGPEGYSRIQIAMGIQGEANAALIASAPALLAENARLLQALRTLHEAGEAHMQSHPSEGAAFHKANADFYKALDNARAALQGGGL